MLWCIKKPHRVEAKDVPLHRAKKPRHEPKELLFHQSAGTAPGAEKFGIWECCAGSCMSPAVLTFTDQSVLYNTSIILHSGMWHRAPLL